MKTVTTIARYLLGSIFSIFGLNGFLHFIPTGPIPPLAAQFLGALSQSHYIAVVFALQLACGLLLLTNRYVPLALTVLGSILFNILLFHSARSVFAVLFENASDESPMQEKSVRLAA